MHKTGKYQKTAGKYPFFKDLIEQWKPRSKKIRKAIGEEGELKNIAEKAGITPNHLTKIISGNVENPRLETINNVEEVLKDLEKKAGV